MGTKHELSDLQGETVPGSHNTDLRKCAGVSAAGCVGCTAELSSFFPPFSSLFFFLLFFFLYVAVFKTVVYFQAS